MVVLAAAAPPRLARPQAPLLGPLRGRGLARTSHGRAAHRPRAPQARPLDWPQGVRFGRRQTQRVPQAALPTLAPGRLARDAVSRARADAGPSRVAAPQVGGGE